MLYFGRHRDENADGLILVNIKYTDISYWLMCGNMEDIDKITDSFQCIRTNIYKNNLSSGEGLVGGFSPTGSRDFFNRKLVFFSVFFGPTDLAIYAFW